MLLAVAGLLAAWAVKAPCLASYRTASGLVALDWRDGRQYTHFCYSDTIPLYGLERLQQGSFPYRTSWPESDSPHAPRRYMEYPVLTGLLQWAAMRVTKALIVGFGDPLRPDPPEVVVYFVVMSVALAASWLAAVAAAIRLAGVRRWDVALIALSPLAVVHAFTNFDTLAVALATAGMLAWSRRRPVPAGVLLGLGTAAKLYPLFLLGPLLVLCWRAGARREWLTAAAAAVGTWLVVNLPIAVLYPRGWWEFFRLNGTRPADHDSIYNAIGTFTGWAGLDGPLAPGQAPRILNAFSLGGFALICLGVATVALTARRRPRFPALAFLVVAGFLLTNKVWSPQYSLWLVPLGVLALARWGPLLVWMLVDAAVWGPRMYYFLHFGEAVAGPHWARVFLATVLVRDLAVLVLCGYVLRDAYRPERDPVRVAGQDDPAGGVLDGAPDRDRPAGRSVVPAGSAGSTP